MSDITLIGLGLMGTGLAKTLHDAGHDLTVWNRSASRMRPFADTGVACARDFESALAASPVVLICIDNYAVTDRLLHAAGIAPLLADRTVVQLSTGTPAEAAAAAAWMAGHGAAYLDGAILAGPDDIGTGESIILLCGDEHGHENASGLLACLGDVRYLGTNIKAASTLDLAWLCVSYGQFLSITHAARLCESEGVDFRNFPGLFPDEERMCRYAKVIADSSFDRCTATLAVWGGALERIRQQGRDAGIDTGFPDYAAGLFKKAVDAGYGDEHVMALVKVLGYGSR